MDCWGLGVGGSKPHISGLGAPPCRASGEAHGHQVKSQLKVQVTAFLYLVALASPS